MKREGARNKMNGSDEDDKRKKKEVDPTVQTLDGAVYLIETRFQKKLLIVLIVFQCFRILFHNE